ncbi:MAG: DUF4864 domain-containing protein [Paracoccaceae bacterium]
MRLGLVVVVAALLAVPAFAQEAPIQSTINSQIEAFKADDYTRAFTYASPTIHEMFLTAENFGSMVATGYPMVVNPAQVEMMDLRTVGGALWQRVRITDQKGQSYLLDYQMVEGPNGWLINAVQLQKSNDVGA